MVTLDPAALATCRTCAAEIASMAVDVSADFTRAERRALAALALAIERTASAGAGVPSMEAEAAAILREVLAALADHPGARP